MNAHIGMFSWRMGLRGTVFAILFIFAAAVTVIWTLASWTDYHDSLADSRTITQALARLLEEHMRGTIDATGLVVQSAAEMVGQEGAGHFSRSVENWQRLRSLSLRLPQVGALLFTGEDGRVLMTSLAFPPPDHNMADRLFFQAHQGGERHAIVGPLVKAKFNGVKMFTVSHRIDHPDGRFAGVIAGALYADYFSTLYQSLALDSGAVLAVAHLDGGLLVHEPRAADNDIWAFTKLKDFTERLIQAPAGTFEGVSPLDRTPRILSYRKVEGLPLVVVAGLSKQQVLLPWRERMARNGALACAALLALAGLSWLALISLRREDGAKVALGNANAALQDMTAELRHANRKLGDALAEKEIAHAAAERANQAKSRFLAAASHDLRQPLQATRLFLDVLLARMEESPLRPVVEKAVEAQEGSEMLLRALLDVSTLEAGTVHPVIETVSAASVMERLYRECLPLAAQKGLELRMAPCHLSVRTDPVLLLRILRNLMNNAIRYTPSGAILIGCRRDGAFVRFELWDTGLGIPEDKLDVIFEDFFQLGNSARDRAQGLGLGLSIVRRMAHLLGHAITVRSQPGRGSVFAVAVSRDLPDKPR